MLDRWKKRRPQEIDMTLSGHLTELRSRLIKVLAVIALLFVAAMAEINPLIGILKSRLPADLYFNSPAEALWVGIKTAFFASLFPAMPYILYQVWKFIEPALKRGEKKMAVPFIVGGAFFFYTGVLFCYFVALPFALNYLVKIGIEMGIRPQIIFSNYVDFTLKFLFGFGLIFMTPVGLVVLGRAGIVTAAWLSRNRRYAIVVNSIVAAILTPTPDVFNMLIMMIPLLILYELGILGIRLVEKKRRSEVKEAGEAHA